VASGEPFCLSWRTVAGAVGYHVLRSPACKQLGRTQLERLFRGELQDTVQHFAIGEQVDTVIDDHDVRGATVMGYWVLAQTEDGALVPVDGLQVQAPGPRVQQRRHVVLQPQAPMPVVFRSGAKPASGPHGLRPVGFLRYAPPSSFVFAEPVGVAIAHYTVWIGTVEPDSLCQDAMWDDVALDANPLQRVTLAGHYRGFRDELNAPGDDCRVAVMATWRDGRVVQVGLEPSEADEGPIAVVA
jgi:hypothetical protein